MSGLVKEQMWNAPYSSTIDSLIYAMVGARMDIIYAVNVGTVHVEPCQILLKMCG